jgi:hypothetical protein
MAASQDTSIKNMSIWVGAPPRCCDVCSTPIASLFYDTRLRGETAWASLCFPCFHIYGAGLGTGVGQRYQLQPNGHWLKTGG